MDSIDTLANDFSTTLHLKADNILKIRKAFSKLAQFKYAATSDSDLAERLGLIPTMRNRITNDFLLINYLTPENGGRTPNLNEFDNIPKIKIGSIPLGILAKWILSKPDYEALVLYFLYIENKSYEQITKEIIMLDINSVMQIQIKYVKALYLELFSTYK